MKKNLKEWKQVRNILWLIIAFLSFFPIIKFVGGEEGYMNLGKYLWMSMPNLCIPLLGYSLFVLTICFLAKPRGKQK